MSVRKQKNVIMVIAVILLITYLFLRSGRQPSTPFDTVHHQPCRYSYQVEKDGVVVWNICRDLDKGIKLDTHRHGECTVYIVVSPNVHSDLTLLEDVSSTFERCDVHQSNKLGSNGNYGKYFPDGVSTTSIELLKTDVDEHNWRLFTETLESGMYHNVRQMLLKIDLTGDSHPSQTRLETHNNERLNVIFNKLKQSGFTLTLSKFVPSNNHCCVYATWVKLSDMRLETDTELATRLQWHSGNIGKTPFHIQPWADGVANGNRDDEANRLLHYLSHEQTHCTDIRRMGNQRDGGWDVCFDPLYGLDPHQCIVYSIGIFKDWSFDEAMAEYGCDVFSFDPSIRQLSHKHSKKVWFYNYGIMDRNSDEYYGTGMDGISSWWKVRTLDGLMAELGHFHHNIDIIKMDIEGGEWQVLRDMLSKGTLQNVKVLIFETHIWTLTEGREKEELRDKYSVLKLLEIQGFKMWQYEEDFCFGRTVQLGDKSFGKEACCYEQLWINSRFQ